MHYREFSDEYKPHNNQNSSIEGSIRAVAAVAFHEHFAKRSYVESLTLVVIGRFALDGCVKRRRSVLFRLHRAAATSRSCAPVLRISCEPTTIVRRQQDMRRPSRDDGSPKTLRRTLIFAVSVDLASEAPESGRPTTEIPIAIPIASQRLRWRSTPAARLVHCSHCSVHAHRSTT